MKTMKKSVSLLLVFAMCLSLLMGIGPVTAYAAAEQSDVYLIGYPRDGDANYDGDWGHPSLTYMNGWGAGRSTTTIVRAMGSYDGTACYCIEPGVHQDTGDTYTSGRNFSALLAEDSCLKYIPSHTSRRLSVM